MKMTLDLPSDLVREMKVRAAFSSQKLKDLTANLIAAGMAAESAKAKGVRARKGAITLPLFKSGKNASARQMSMTQLIALEQETQLAEDRERLGQPV